MRKGLLLSLLGFFSACSYHAFTTTNESKALSISVPPVVGDYDGTFNSAIVKALAVSGKFECSRAGGDYILEVKLDGDNLDRVGFQYDRDSVSGDLRKNLIGTENRRSVGAIIKLIDATTQKVVLGPVRIDQDVVYDYLDSDNLYDLSFINTVGKRVTVLDYSLGQLDTIEGAQDASLPELYHKLAEKIVDGMITQKW